MNISSCTPLSWVNNEQFWKQQIQEQNFWDSVPLINTNDTHLFKDNTLVRFRGMVQDMYDPELYFEKYEVEDINTKNKYLKPGKYYDKTDLTEGEQINFDSKENVSRERQTVVVITIPCLNTWVQDLEAEQNKLKAESEQKELQSPNRSTKRQMEDEEMEVKSINSEEEKNKKICTNNQTGPSNRAVVSQEHILNFPIPESKGKCCHLKVYHDFESIKLNNMIEVVGFLSVDPILTEVSYHNNEFENAMETQTHHPPPSLVPRIHCVAFRPIKHCNPLTKGSVHLGDFNNYRKELSVILTQLLLGDALAADYVICQLVSNIYDRKEIMALGKCTLNISNIPAVKYPNYVQDVYEFLQSLVTKSHYLPMTLDNMNETTFIPKKDYECNRLTSGLLQLSDNTHVVLDETKLQPGQLNNSACRGLAAISNIIKTQRAQYDFQFYQMEFNCDIPFLIMSEGKSLLPSDYHLPLEPDEHCLATFEEIKVAAKHFLKSELLDSLRAYLTVARHSSYEIGENVLELVQNQFVQMRQTDKISADDLHQLLVLARLVCLSRGQTSLDDACWQHACAMEKERKSRIASRAST